MDDIAYHAAVHATAARNPRMRRTSRLALAALGFGLLPVLAAAQFYYPRLTAAVCAAGHPIG